MSYFPPFSTRPTLLHVAATPRAPISSFILVLCVGLFGSISPQSLFAVDVTTYQSQVTPEGDWGPALAQALAAVPSGGTLRFPAGSYRLEKPLVIDRSVGLVFENGARLWTEDADLIIIRGGEEIVIEGVGGRGELFNFRPDNPNFDKNAPRAKSRRVINLDQVDSQARPSLRVRSMYIKGFSGIEGIENSDKGPMNNVEVDRCLFETFNIAMGYRHAEVHSLRVENSEFIGRPRYGIWFTSPMPGGAIVRGNVLRNMGIIAIQLSGGKASQVADGCTDYLPSAIVHENQILGGGHLATLADSYIHGILVYGHNVSVQGNIVRNFNRGEPVPGASCGHHIKLPDGTFYRGHWIATETDPHRRLAGAAIYLKANHAVVSGNICSQSGWRSVIEVKTGSVEHYVLVSGNVVDGRSLAIDSSFGFECNSGRSAWMNNMVSDMPNQAFVVRSTFANTFMNNAIYNAKVGFALSGATPGKDEFIAMNRFFNVEHPVLVEDGGVAAGQDLHLPPPLAIASADLLPRPQESLRGQLVSLAGAQGDSLLQCVRLPDGKYAWRELGPGEKIYGDQQWEEVGPNMAVNPDQSADALTEEELARCDKGQDNAICRGWTATIVSPGEKKLTDLASYLSFDPEKKRGGKGSLRIQFKEDAGNWLLRQRLKLPAARYRATLQILSELPENVSWYAQVPGRRPLVKGERSDDWQTLTVDFEIPADASDVLLGAYGNRFTTGKSAWIGGVSVRRLVLCHN
jgi:hypothetical protein